MKVWTDFRIDKIRYRTLVILLVYDKREKACD